MPYIHSTKLFKHQHYYANNIFIIANYQESIQDAVERTMKELLHEKKQEELTFLLYHLEQVKTIRGYQIGSFNSFLLAWDILP